MKREDIDIYRAIQKNAEMAVATIDTISDKIYDENLSRLVAREALKYADIRGKAIDKLLQGKAEVYRAKPYADFVIKSGIQINTALNTSTGHIAELMIQGSNRGIIDMCRILNKYPDAFGPATEMAKEFMDFEERNIARLKKYL